jgi:peptide/nickel transport system substrate-binding protein
MMQLVIYGQLANSLVEIDHENRPVPELAESWEASPDAKQWTFKLRKGVEFHNGKTMDADDVVYSINHHLGEESKSAAKALLKAIADIRKDDKHTVTFILKDGNADFPYIMSDYHLCIMPAGGDTAAGVFTGAYVLKDFEPGVRAFAVRNPNFFKSDRGHFDEVETIAISDVNARTNALKTGQIDVMNPVNGRPFTSSSAPPTCRSCGRTDSSTTPSPCSATGSPTRTTMSAWPSNTPSTGSRW